MPRVNPEEIIPAGALHYSEPTPEGVPSGLETLRAGFEKDNLVAAYSNRATLSAAIAATGELDPSYNPYDDMAGYESYHEYLSGAVNAREMALRKSEIDREQAVDSVLAASGAGGIGARVAAGVLDPLTLASLALPIGWGGIGTRIGRGMLVGAATTAAEAGLQESVLQGTQPTRSAMEAVYGVTGAALLGGLAGSFVARRLGDVDGVKTLVAAIEQEALGTPLVDAAGRMTANGTATARVAEEAQNQVIDSVGAARVVDDIQLVRGKSRLFRFAARLTPAGFLAQARLPEARRLGVSLLENAFRFVSEKTGLPVSAGSAAETRLKRWTHGAMAVARRDLDRFYAAYRRRTAGTGQPMLSRDDFRIEAAKAARRGDMHAIPEVGAVAKSFRDNVIRPLFEEGAKARLFDPYIRSLAHRFMDTGLIDSIRQVLRQLKHQARVAHRAEVKALRRSEREGLRQLAKSRSTQIAVIDSAFNQAIAAQHRLASAEITRRLAALDTYDELTRNRVVAEVREEFDPRIKAIEDRRSAVIEKVRTDKQQYAEQLRGATTLFDIKARQLEAELAAAPEEGKAVIARRLAEIRSRRAGAKRSMQEILQEDYPWWRMTQQEASQLYNIKLAELRSAADEALEARLSAVADADEAGVKAARRDVAKEFHEAVKRLNADRRFGARIVRKQAAEETAALRKATRSRSRELAKELEAELDELGSFSFPTRGEIADSVVHAYTRDLPDEYITPEIRDTLNKVRAHFGDAQHAQSYLMRIYDHNRITADNGRGLKNALATYFQQQGASEVDAMELATTAVNNIRGYGHGAIVGYNGRSITDAAPQLQRELAVPDEVVEPWLISDIDSIALSYARQVGSRLVLAQASRDYGMPGAWRLIGDMRDVRERYSELINRTSDATEVRRLEREMNQVESHVKAAADRLLGLYDLPTDPTSRLTVIAPVLKQMNYLTKMGGVVLSSFADIAQPILALGLSRSYGKLFSTALKGSLQTALKMSRAEFDRVGAAVDLLVPLRMRVGDEHGEWFGRGLEGLQTASHVFTRVSGFAYWQTLMKSMAGLMVQDEILKNVGRLADALDAGTALTHAQKIALSDLARYGIDAQMIQRIGTQATETHGTLRLADTTKWTDQHAIEAYRDALAKMTDTIIISPGAGDKFKWIHGQWPNVIMQFKSFAMATISRAVLPWAQDPSLARQVNGLLATSMFGAFTYMLKEINGGRGEALAETLDKASEGDFQANLLLFNHAMANAGLGTFPQEVVNLVRPFLGSAPLGRYTLPQSFLEVVGGPSINLIEDAYDIGRAVGPDQEVTAATAHKMRKMLPFQNILAIKRVLDEVEQSVVDEFNLKETRQ